MKRHVYAIIFAACALQGSMIFSSCPFSSCTKDHSEQTQDSSNQEDTMPENSTEQANS